MQSSEARALGSLAGAAMAGTAAFVDDMHQAILRRSTAHVPFGEPVGVVHNAIAKPIYAGVRGLTGALGLAAGHGYAATRPPDAPALADSPRAAIGLGALSGLYGDLLHRDGSPLAVSMSVRSRNGAVAPTPEGLATAFPDATACLAVFVHGLGETETAWRLFAPPEGPATYGERLRRDLGSTPLYLRYNTGLHISENGRLLAALLEEMVEHWPVPVREIALFGHSMGGLVIRSAAHYGQEQEAAWVPKLRHVFCLASPHHGAPLEKAVHVAAWALDRVPETRGLARFLKLRSAGIKDLRYGYLVDEDWDGRDPDALFEDTASDVAFVDSANYYALSAAVTRDERHPVGHLVGDLLVRRRSASGHGPRGRRVPFDVDNGHHAGGLNHFTVLNHPDVYRQIRVWLERERKGLPVPA